MEDEDAQQSWKNYPSQISPHGFAGVFYAKFLADDQVVRAWDQEVCFLCGLRFKLYGCSYNSHWRLTRSLISRPVELVEVRASWSGHPR